MWYYYLTVTFVPVSNFDILFASFQLLVKTINLPLVVLLSADEALHFRGRRPSDFFSWSYLYHLSLLYVDITIQIPPPIGMSFGISSSISLIEMSFHICLRGVSRAFVEIIVSPDCASHLFR